MVYRIGRLSPTSTAIVPCFLLLQTLSLGFADEARKTVVQTSDMHGAAIYRESFLAVHLNGEDLYQTALFLIDRQRRLLVGVKDFTNWRLRRPAGPLMRYKGIDFVPLDRIQGLSYELDSRKQSVSIEAAANLFKATSISGAMSTPVPVPSSFGGFLNYDFLAEYANSATHVNGLAEIGTFNAWGVGTANLLGRDLSGNSRLIRIDTTWTTDFPAQRSSLRLLDAVSRPADWSLSVRFAGIQWASNFATQPRFISFPLPTFSGESALPSTAELYVNNALRLRSELPAGPFSIQNAPVSTGLNEAQLIVTDLLGRERIITEPFYVSSRLLSPGIDDFSYEAGLVRKNFGTESFDYGRLFAAATHRRGFTESFTGEIHGEFTKSQGSLGLNGLYLFPEVGVFGVSLAGSLNRNNGRSGSGGLVGFSFERQARWLTITGRTQFASKGFSLLGLESGKPAPRQLSQISLSISASDDGSLSMGYIHQDYRDRTDVQLVRAGYNRRIANLGYLNVAVTGSLKGSFDPAVSLAFTIPFGERSSLNLGGTFQSGFHEGTLQFQQNLPRGAGFGYCVLASAGTPERLEAGISLQNDTGLYSLEASHYGNQNALRGSLSGGFGLLGGRPFFARRLENSFALVQVPTYPDVRIYADNQLVGRTDSNGDALIPRLRAYDRNPIRIEQADLPLDAEVGELKLEAVPYFRSGYVLEFPIRRSRGARFRIVLPDGEEIPVGARVQIENNKKQFPVALRGETYVTGLESHNRMKVIWGRKSCEFELAYPKSAEAIPDLGTVVCNGGQP